MGFLRWLSSEAEKEEEQNVQYQIETGLQQETERRRWRDESRNERERCVRSRWRDSSVDDEP